MTSFYVSPGRTGITHFHPNTYYQNEPRRVSACGLWVFDGRLPEGMELKSSLRDVTCRMCRRTSHYRVAAREEEEEGEERTMGKTRPSPAPETETIECPESPTYRLIIYAPESGDVLQSWLFDHKPQLDYYYVDEGVFEVSGHTSGHPQTIAVNLHTSAAWALVPEKKEEEN